MWVGRMQVHPPTAGTQHLTAPTATNSPSCPGKSHLESSTQLWEVGWCSVSMGTDSKCFWWPLATPLPALNNAIKRFSPVSGRPT